MFLFFCQTISDRVPCRSLNFHFGSNLAGNSEVQYLLEGGKLFFRWPKNFEGRQNWSFLVSVPTTTQFTTRSSPTNDRDVWKMVKQSVKGQESINSKLALVMKSGKYSLGYHSTLKHLRQLKAKLIIIANNCPPLRKSEIEYYAMLSHTLVHHYNGNNVELGTACGKYFAVSIMSILDQGDSDLIRMIKA